MTVKQGQWSEPFIRASIFKIARGYLYKISPQWGFGMKKSNMMVCKNYLSISIIHFIKAFTINVIIMEIKV